MSCKKTAEDYSVNKNEITSAKEIHPGKELMETYCFSCHMPPGSVSHDDRIGPPMKAVKMHYKEDGVSKEEFIKQIQQWINSPSEENARMHGALDKFGVMPPLPLPNDISSQIADYMYDNDVSNYEKGKTYQSQNNLEEKTPSEIGLHYALSTKKQLGKNLLGKINSEGTIAAINFCNERAYPLTDSMQTVFNAQIKRVSDKPRNQGNKANTIELTHIETFKQLLNDKKDITPIVEESGNKVHFYYPITTNKMCLQCHGVKDETLKTDAYKQIKTLYPQDKAIGYSENQVRGIWSIKFDKDE